jgi:hypothetical protein
MRDGQQCRCKGRDLFAGVVIVLRQVKPPLDPLQAARQPVQPKRYRRIASLEHTDPQPGVDCIFLYLAE